MKKVLSRWLLPLVLAFGIAGNAAAHGDHERHGSHDSTPVSVTFSDSFENRMGDTFLDPIHGFKISSVADFVTLKVTTIDLEHMNISIFKKNKNGDAGILAKSFSFEDFLNTSFSLDPGRYFAIFTGKISSDLAVYSGAASAAPVPEPAEWMMIMAGVAMMGFVVSRRRNDS